jgi:hypothetical protein
VSCTQCFATGSSPRKASGAPCVNRTRPLLQTQNKAQNKQKHTQKKQKNHNTTSMFLGAPVGPAALPLFCFHLSLSNWPSAARRTANHTTAPARANLLQRTQFCTTERLPRPLSLLFSSHSVDCTGPPHPSARLFSSPALHTKKPLTLSRSSLARPLCSHHATLRVRSTTNRTILHHTVSGSPYGVVRSLTTTMPSPFCRMLLPCSGRVAPPPF